MTAGYHRHHAVGLGRALGVWSWTSGRVKACAAREAAWISSNRVPRIALGVVGSAIYRRRYLPPEVITGWLGTGLGCGVGR